MHNITTNLHSVIAWAQVHTTAALLIVVALYLLLRTGKKTGR